MDSETRFVVKISTGIFIFAALSYGALRTSLYFETQARIHCARAVAPSHYEITHQTIDQILENDGGYRIQYHDSDDKVETLFLWEGQIPTNPQFPQTLGLKGLSDLATGRNINIYRDLLAGQPQVMTKITYEIPGCDLVFEGVPHLQYVEIHMPPLN